MGILALIRSAGAFLSPWIGYIPEQGEAPTPFMQLAPQTEKVPLKEEREQGIAAGDSSQARLAAWSWLSTALTLAAGHGLFLFFAVTRTNLLPSRRELGGGTTAYLVLYFIAAVPLALVVLALRRPLLRLPARTLRLLAAAATLVTAAVFAVYLSRIWGT